jgi:CRISPR type IV-associated protein Csf3
VEPLRIVAKLDGPLTLTDGSLRIDALAMWAKAQVLGLPPPGFGPLEEVDIPIAKSACGRVYLCSFACPRFDQHEKIYLYRRFPVPEAQALAESSFTRIRISAGPQKSYRIHDVLWWAERDELEWFCIGEPDELRSLLSIVTHLGRRRAVGRGKVQQWSVGPCESWGEGFPVVMAGQPMRALPLDWPGLDNPEIARAVLAPPYYQNWREELCAIPARPE